MNDNEGKPASDADLDFDPRAFETFLRQSLGGADGPLRLTRIQGGQSNPTYFVDHGSRRMVLRKKPAGAILKGAHAVEREYRVLNALKPTGVPVPEAILLCENPTIIGTPFYLMERVEGRVLSDCSLPGMSPAERRAIYMAMAEALAALHRVDPRVIGLEDYGRPSNYFVRQLARWNQQLRQSDGPPIPDLYELMEWLEANMPPEDGRMSIAHGDFRLGNMMFHPTEPRVIAILDWELSTLGHPLADLGFCCMPWHTSPDEYGGILGLDMTQLGIPAEAEFVTHYMTHVGSEAELRPFHVAFALFRFSVIFVGIADRVRGGNAADANAQALGPLAKRFAKRALDVTRPAVSCS
ncbi:phosphotransferase family protein [Aminobacter sp. LjRoot7]|uniref:phosphotransferase family protein n=1 Tax=Aminobacter sp. LjRoot7 TaxID=3342335 RepID=UPI003ED13E41